jgi:hypothetical protein
VPFSAWRKIALAAENKNALQRGVPLQVLKKQVRPATRRILKN